MKKEIQIKSSVLEEMQAYAWYADKHFPSSEIAGWAHYSPKNGIYKLAPLLEQEAHSAEVITDVTKLVEDGYNMSDMVVQWHSHCRMSCSPSGEYGDLGNIKTLGKIMPYLITIIINLKMEYYARLDIFRTKQFVFDEPITMDVVLVPYYDNKKIEKDVLQKLKLKSYPQSQVDDWHYRYKYGDYDDYYSASPQSSLFEENSSFVIKKEYNDDNTFRADKKHIINIIKNCDKSDEFAIFEHGDGISVKHKKSLNNLVFTRYGTFVNGKKSTFSEFCNRCGIHNIYLTGEKQ